MSFAISDRDKIPRSQGIYAFYLDLISPVKLGLIGRGDFSEESIGKARITLKRRVKKLLSFVRSSKLSGRIVEESKAYHLSEIYNIQAIEEPPTSVLESIDNIPNALFYEYVCFLQTLVLFSQPVYVGITTDQTLFTRYNQHMNDYNGDGDKNSFGLRLKQSGFDWDDIIFACKDITVEDNGIILGIVEKYLQSISNPVLCIR